MNSNLKLLALTLAAAVLLFATPVLASAAVSTGSASIGFSADSIYYLPYGISGVTPNLNLDFGTRHIDTSTPTMTYTSLNQGGYAVNNASGGASGYRVSLGLSSFDNGLEGAALTVRPDSRGLISGEPNASDAPILMNNMGYVTLEADGLSNALVLEASRYKDDPDHAALGRWGFNFYGELDVYTNTIVAGNSRAVMTWELAIV